MRAMIRIGVLTAALLAGIAPWFARPASACSWQPSPNLVTLSDVVVAGRFGSWERLPASPSSRSIPIRIRLSVERVFKGVAASEVTVVNSDSLKPDGSWGSPGVCETFGRDPAGRYVVLGLSRVGDDYVTSIRSIVSQGFEPGSPEFEERLAGLPLGGESSLYLAEPRPCIGPAGAAECEPGRLALWNGDEAAWAAEGISDRDARTAATVAFRARAGDQVTRAALMKAAGLPYVEVAAVRYLSDEIWGRPSYEAVPEFVELVNLGGAPQNLTGWALHSPERGRALTLPAGIVLQPGMTCWFPKGDHFSLSEHLCSAGVEFDDFWPDEGGRVVLTDADGVVRSDLRYSADPYNQPPPPNLEGVRLPR